MQRRRTFIFNSHRCALHPVPMLWRRAPDTISPAPTSLRMHTRCTCASGLHRQPCRQSMGMCEQCTRLARTNARTVARTMHAPCTVHIPRTRRTPNTHAPRVQQHGTPRTNICLHNPLFAYTRPHARPRAPHVCLEHDRLIHTSRYTRLTVRPQVLHWVINLMTTEGTPACTTLAYRRSSYQC